MKMPLLKFAACIALVCLMNSGSNADSVDELRSNLVEAAKHGSIGLLTIEERAENGGNKVEIIKLEHSNNKDEFRSTLGLWSALSTPVEEIVRIIDRRDEKLGEALKKAVVQVEIRKKINSMWISETKNGKYIVSYVYNVDEEHGNLLLAVTKLIPESSAVEKMLVRVQKKGKIAVSDGAVREVLNYLDTGNPIGKEDVRRRVIEK